MGNLRAFFQMHRGLAFALVVMALALKALLPTGAMVGGNDWRTITVQICHDVSGAISTKQILVPFTKNAGEVPGSPAKGECPFCALSMAAIGGAAPVLLALALAYIMLVGLAPIRFALTERFAYIRPPLRGPPALF